MFLNPIVGMIHNVKENRWHPILFDERPLPGNPENLIRHKSLGHHTVGFPTRAKALVNIDEDLIPKCDCPVKKALEKDFPWDGEGVPAMVVFFKDNGDGTATPMLG